MLAMSRGESDLQAAFDEALGVEALPAPVKAAMARGLIKAVEVAAEAATAALDSATRRRLVRTTALATAVIVATISIPVTYVITAESASSIKHEAQMAAHKEAVTNCEAQAKSRPQGNARALVQSITVDLAEDAFNVFPQKFKDREIASINARIQQERRFIPGQFPEHVVEGEARPLPIHSFHDLQTVIAPVPLIDCRKLLSG